MHRLGERIIGMTNLKLQADEGIILQNCAVGTTGKKISYIDELYLTNIHIIHVIKGVKGEVRSAQRYPVKTIKIIDGVPQVHMRKNSNNGTFQLQILLLDEQLYFSFAEGKKAVVEWVKILTKFLLAEEKKERGAKAKEARKLPNVTVAIKDTVGTIKDVIKTTGNISVECRGCGVLLSGAKGEIVACEYCGTKQTLKAVRRFFK